MGWYILILLALAKALLRTGLRLVRTECGRREKRGKKLGMK